MTTSGSDSELHSGRLLARNTLFNLVGQLVPLVVGLVAIPHIIEGLGRARFGILTLGWAIILYLTIFDLGLGRATTKFVADARARGDGASVPRLVWTAIMAQLALGILGSTALVLMVPLLTRSVLNIGTGLEPEATRALQLLAASGPLLLISLTFRGALEASQRFDLVNVVRVPTSAGNFILPAFAATSGLGLVWIIGLLLVLQLFAAASYYALCLKVFPNLNSGPRFDRRTLRVMFRFGGWITISDVVSPLLVYIDRFAIATLLSASAVAFYTAPFEIVTRLWIVPTSLLTTMFPAFSTVGSRGDSVSLERLVVRSVKYLLLVVGILAMGLLTNARDILDWWLGSSFALRGTAVLQLLAIGLLVNSLAQIFYSLVQALGRPDLTAKFHMVELPFYLGILWLLISAWGLAGAALAWSIRVSVDFLLLVGAGRRLSPIRRETLVRERLPQVVTALTALAGLFALIAWTSQSFAVQTTLAFGVTASFMPFAWRYLLSDEDRTQFAGLLVPVRRR